VENLILTNGNLEFRLVSEKYNLSNFLGADGKVNEKRLPKGITYIPNYQDQGDTSGFLCEDPLMTGADLTDAKVETDSLSRPYIAIQFNEQGKNQFSDITSQNIGRHLAIVLDGSVFSAPVIKSKIA